VTAAAAIAALPATGTATAGPFDSAVGTWWGQVEHFAKVNAVVDESAAAVVDLTLRVEAGGKISGASPRMAASCPAC
jgi:hypothetical protein